MDRTHFLEILTSIPAPNCGRGLGAIRALWSAWQPVNVFFFRREWIRRFPGISVWGLILFSYVPTRYDSSCFSHGAQRQTTFTRFALGAQTTDAGNNSSSAQSMLQPVGYNATRAVLLTVYSIGPLDPSSRIELTCELLLLLLLLPAWSAVCVIDATGTALLCCCCAVLLL